MKKRLQRRVSAKKRKEFPNVRLVAKLLLEKYGVPSLGNKANTFSELLYIILSSKTPESNFQRTYLALKRKFPKADQLSKAPVRSIESTIRFGGLAPKKARQISSIARRLKAEFGSVTLSPLSKMDDESAERFLTSLPGVSYKTARCILMYSLGRHVFPVDVHCHRVAERLGWTNRSPWTKSGADTLQNGIPPKLRKPIHVGMVLLGREFCLPKKPLCGDCPLKPHCPTGLGK